MELELDYVFQFGGVLKRGVPERGVLPEVQSLDESAGKVSPDIEESAVPHGAFAAKRADIVVSGY